MACWFMGKIHISLLVNGYFAYGKRVLISVQLNSSFTRILVKVITKLILKGTAEQKVVFIKAVQLVKTPG